MNKLAKKLKQIVKGECSCDKPSFGKDPNDPWSAKAGINESGLNDYLLAKGINPKFISRDTKISHAKSNEYKKWQKDHKFEEVEYVTEDAMLNQYLKAKGINPVYVSKDQKIAYAKSGAFLKWKAQHMHEQVFTHSPVQQKQHMIKKKEHHGTPIRTEETDQKDTVTLDIPFMIRVLEYAREDAKDDMALHKVVEKLIEIRNKGTLTMDDYDFVTKIKEEYQIDEVKEPKQSALDKFRAAAAERAKEAQKRKEAMERLHAAGGEDMKGAIDRLAASLNKEETEHKVGDSVTVHSKFFGKQKGKVTKVDSQSVHVQRDGKKYSEKYPHSAVDRNKIEKHSPKKNEFNIGEESKLDEGEFMAKVKKAVAADKAKRYAHYSKTDKEDRPVSSKLYGQMSQHQKKLSQEDVFQDCAAATQTNFDGANSPDNTEPYQPGMNRKREMTKSARIIKSIYKKKGIKEELYDHEKEDKSVATYGKKPKLKELDPQRTSDDKPQAAAVLSGGTTMTGEPRDTLEIDPEMKRPLRFDKRK